MAKRQKRNRASAKKRAMEHGSYDLTTLKIPQGVSLLKLKEGIMKVDFVEYEVTQEGNKWAEVGQTHYERTFWIHRNVGPNDEALVCAKKTAGKKCFICEHVAKLNKEADADEKFIKSLLPKERQLFQGIDHAEKEKGIQLLEISHHTFGKRLDKEIKDAEESEGVEAFAAHTKEEGGMTLKLGVEEKSFDGRDFMSVETVKFLPRKIDIDSDMLANVMDLDKLLIIPTYEEGRKLFMQDDGDDAKPADTDDDDDDDDDDLDGDGELDDDDDDKPTPAKPDDDDDDDDKPAAAPPPPKVSKEDKKALKLVPKGTRVKGTYKDVVFKGSVVKVDEENCLVTVKTDGDEKRVCKPTELTVLKPKAPPPPPSDDDDDDDEAPAPAPKTEGKKGEKSPSKPADDDDDDEIPFDDDDDDDD